ncbi:pentatricopeptide repeat-containing protein [Prunus yedoensis var. nudiflora]|uniref:Pentatricopeptide repeat-containing protein n=1 Tax=Prunus yedoensis var. nudiflora TaxID=2094558 RepID=A0A314UX03_PRUYE|nr:pentatricopeptide repeat-containing protein [Prunus yedoensis var. nudiflora]
MLSASSRRLRCYIAAAADLCARNFGPNSAPNQYPIHKPTPLSTPLDKPLFSTISRFISNSRASSSSEEEAIANQILSDLENAAPLLESSYKKRVFLSSKAFNRVLVAAASERNDLSLVPNLFKLQSRLFVNP